MLSSSMQSGLGRLGAALCLFAIAAPTLAQDDPLPSWTAGTTKQSIVSFVQSVTEESGDRFVPPADRLAVFDNDGTLWIEQPIYVQLAFALDRVRALAPQHQEWQTTEPFASILQGDVAGALSGGEQAVAQIVAATHSGLTSEQFSDSVRDWLKTARHPEKGRPYTELVYQPMLELLVYLRANGFKTYIVSGGGTDFMRVFSEEVYGIPPEQVVGSSIKGKFAIIHGKPVVVKQAEIEFIDDGPGKPVGILSRIGRTPIAAFGNSDGDLQMLEFTCLPPGPDFCAVLRHTDAKREWTYDRDSRIGRLDKGLDAAATYGWTVIDMAEDWKTVFAD